MYIQYSEHRKATCNFVSFTATLSNLLPKQAGGQYFFCIQQNSILPGMHTLFISRHAMLHVVIAACESGLNTCSKPHRLSACAAEWAAYAGDWGSNPAARTILVFLFSIYVRSSLYSAYSVILNHLDFDSRFFVFSAAKLSLDLAVRATVWFILGCMQNKYGSTAAGE